MGLSGQLMGFSTPSTGKAGRASPLRDSLRSPKSHCVQHSLPLTLASLAVSLAQRPLRQQKPPEAPGAKGRHTAFGTNFRA